MDLTKLCLRTMLWSLGLTAATGLLLVFLSHSRLLENVLFTLAATTGAMLLLWPLSFWLRSHQSRLAGLVGMALVLADYFVLFVLIWGTWLLQQPGFLANFSWETALWETFWFTLLTGFPAVVLLRFWYVPQAYVAARVGTGICLLAFLELMLGAWLERSLQGRGFDLGRLVEAGGLTGLYSLPILACLVGFPRTRPWRWLGVMAAGAGWIIASVHVLSRSAGNTAGEVAFVLLTTAGVAVGYANLCLLPRLKPEHEWLRKTTLAAFFVAAVLLDINLLGDLLHFAPNLWDTWYGGRLLMATGILAACGSLAIIVLTQFHRIQQVEETHGDFAFTTLAVVCPACKELQTLAVGESTCTRCGLRFFIRLGHGDGRMWGPDPNLPAGPASAPDKTILEERIKENR